VSNHLLDQLLDLVRLAQVAGSSEAASPHRLYLVGHTVESSPAEPYFSRWEILRPALDIRQGEVRTLLRQLQSRGTADTPHPSSPCNQGNFVMQFRHDAPPLSCLYLPPRFVTSSRVGTIL
jgi:hypothetical protein